MSFDLTTVTSADICDEIESQTGYLFEDGSKLGSSFEVTKEEAESRTMREWLGIFGCYVGCNWSLRSYWLNSVLVSRITQLPLYYSGNSFSATINAPVTVENAVTFSRVVSRGKDGTFKSRVWYCLIFNIALYNIVAVLCRILTTDFKGIVAVCATLKCTVLAP